MFIQGSSCGRHTSWFCGIGHESLRAHENQEVADKRFFADRISQASVGKTCPTDCSSLPGVYMMRLYIWMQSIGSCSVVGSGYHACAPLMAQAAGVGVGTIKGPFTMSPEPTNLCAT